MQEKINQFVENLSNEINFTAENNYKNPWKDESNKQNLIKFLNKYKDAKYILIGEAPGRKGCLQCGVPFCDDLTLSQLIEVSCDKEQKSKEESAQRIFNTFGNNFIAWNAFPYQPCGANGCNRIPNASELAYGMHFLEQFLEIFCSDKKTIIILGNKAELAFKRIPSKKYSKIKYTKLSHPSRLADRYRDGLSWTQYVKERLLLCKNV